METIGAYEVKTYLSDLLRRVEKGESFTITRNGVPVARLLPIVEKPPRDAEQAIADLLEFRKQRAGHGLAVAEIKELINEGRRL
jgi:prevent-host-death family protein